MRSGWRADPYLTGGNVVGDDRASARHRRGANVDWRHEQRVAAQRGIVLDHGVALQAAFGTEVDGDRAGADVDVFADIGVTDVAEVMHLGASADAAGFDLRVVAQVSVVFNDCPGPKMTERADLDSSAHPGALED